jgi:hypothetical protein
LGFAVDYSRLEFVRACKLGFRVDIPKPLVLRVDLTDKLPPFIAIIDRKFEVCVWICLTDFMNRISCSYGLAEAPSLLEPGIVFPGPISFPVRYPSADGACKTATASSST